MFVLCADGNISVGIIYFYYLFWEYNKDVCLLFIDFEKAYDSIKRESLYDILIKFGVPKTLVRLIKTCLDGTQSEIRIAK